MPNHAIKGPKKRFVLPFATPCANSFKDFKKNMEMAAVVYLAESKREKGESKLLKKTDEKLVFIAEAYYPIWLIPYNKATLIFDGLCHTSHTLSYDTAPDIELFNKDIQRNKKTTEAYTAALTRNIDYFSNFKGKEEIEIEGLIVKPDLKEDIKNFLPLAKELKKSPTPKVVLKHQIKTPEINASLKQITALRKKIDEDIKNIDAGMKLLNAATTRRVRAIKAEIRKTRETHHKRIQKSKLASMRRLQQIQALYNRKIARTSKKYKKRLLKLNKNQIKLKKTLENLRKEAKRYQAKRQYSRRRKRKRNERLWKLKLESNQKQLSKLRKRIKAITRRIREAENAQKHEIAKQRILCCARIESANKKFRDLEGSKQAEIIMKRQEIATLEYVTRCITTSMQEIAQKKKLIRVKFDRIAIKQGKQSCRLVYLPFYLVRYEKGDKKRYTVYSPSVIGDMGILIRMKGALGAKKVKALLQTRSEAISTFLNQILKLFKKKPMLEKDITEAGIRNSILLRKKSRIDVKKGLEELENENWISAKELQNINRILYIYSALIDQRTKARLKPKRARFPRIEQFSISPISK